MKRSFVPSDALFSLMHGALSGLRGKALHASSEGIVRGHVVRVTVRKVMRNTMDGPQPTWARSFLLDGKRATRAEGYSACGDEVLRRHGNKS